MRAGSSMQPPVATFAVKLSGINPLSADRSPVTRKPSQAGESIPHAPASPDVKIADSTNSSVYSASVIVRVNASGLLLSRTAAQVNVNVYCVPARAILSRMTW